MAIFSVWYNCLSCGRRSSIRPPESSSLPATRRTTAQFIGGFPCGQPGGTGVPLPGRERKSDLDK
jgi:hypothetical protein